MYYIKNYQSIKEFAETVLPILNENEAQNNILIGALLRAMNGGDTTDWLYLTVNDDAVWADTQIKLVAMRTPPFSLLAYAPQNKIDLEALRKLAGIRLDVPGIFCEKQMADAYLKESGKTISNRTDLPLQVLKHFNDIATPKGVLRLYCEDDLEYLPRWMCSFRDDCALDDDFNEAVIRDILRKEMGVRRQYVWESCDKIPVSMLKLQKKGSHGMHIGAVYTPPQFRNKGYATACVKAACELAMLEDGIEYCSLFADAINPVSNHVYHKIGFVNICYTSDIKFVK